MFFTSGWTALPLPSPSFQGHLSRDEHWSEFLVLFSCPCDWHFWLCSDFANRDQKSFFASIHFHSSILSIKSVNELQYHSVNLRANCASRIFYDIFMPHALVIVLQQGLCEYSWGQEALMAILCSWEGVQRVCSWPWYMPCIFIRLYPDILQTHQLTRQKVLASACGFWLEHVPLSLFHGLLLLWRWCHHFPCPSNLGTGTRHWWLAVLKRLLFILRSGAGMLPPVFRSLSIIKFFFSKLISMPHHTVNSCVTSSKVFIPSGSQQKSKCRQTMTEPLILANRREHPQQSSDQDFEQLRERDDFLRYTCIKRDCCTFCVVWCHTDYCAVVNQLQ